MAVGKPRTRVSQSCIFHCGAKLTDVLSAMHFLLSGRERTTPQMKSNFPLSQLTLLPTASWACAPAQKCFPGSDGFMPPPPSGEKWGPHCNREKKKDWFMNPHPCLDQKLLLVAEALNRVLTLPPTPNLIASVPTTWPFFIFSNRADLFLPQVLCT